MEINELMGLKEMRLDFEDWAEFEGLDLCTGFAITNSDANPYQEERTRLAYKAWCAAMNSALFYRVDKNE